jgi:hypothetical protein
VTPASFSVSADDVLLLAQSKLVEGRMTFDPVPYSPAGPPGDALLVRLAGGDWSVAREASFGGSGDEDLVAMTRAADGTIWVGGSTTSADLPVAGAVQPLPGSGPGGTDAFVAAFDPDDLSVRFATYLGGSAAERAGGIAAAPDGSAWIVGATASEDFPETEGSATGVGKITDPPVRGARSGHYDLHVANLRRGDAALRPAAPTDLSATVLDANTVRLAWGGASDGFAVLRRDRAGWSRVAQVAAGTTEWTDVRAPAGRELTYAVQALSAAGGSAPSFAEAVTPATLDVRVVSGDARAVSSEPVRTNLFRAAGTLAVGASSIDAAFNPRRDGFDCTMLTDDGGEEAVISIPANDRRWRRTGRTWRWASDGMRLTFQPATGRFDIRVASYWRSLWPLGASPRPLRVTVGNDAGSVTPEWKIVSAHHAAVR